MVRDVVTTSGPIFAELACISADRTGTASRNEQLNCVEMFPKELTGYLMLLSQLLKWLSQVRILPLPAGPPLLTFLPLGSNMIFTLAASIVRDTKALDGTLQRA
jgi:hypothetical protein